MGQTDYFYVAVLVIQSRIPYQNRVQHFKK